jgi:hypothetical protein
VAALVLTALEVAIANAWLVAGAPSDLWRNESPTSAAIKSHVGREHDSGMPPRIFRGSAARWRPQSFAQQSSSNRPAEIVRWEHDTLFPKYHLPAGLSLVESYGSIKLVDYESLLFVAKQHGPQQPDGSALPQPTALRLLGTEFVILPDQHQPEFAERISADNVHNWPQDAALWKLNRKQPRAWIVHDVIALPPLPFPLRIESVDERTREVLFPEMKARDFSTQAVVETSEPPPGIIVAIQATPPPSSERCIIARYGPQQIVIDAKLAAPGLIVLGEAWYPGWRVKVSSADGSTTSPPILRTNRVLRGVWLPAGEHLVVFSYEPASFLCGAAISAGGWLILGAAAFVIWMNRWRVK